MFRRTIDLQDESSYDRETVGFALRAGYPLAERLRHSVSYTLKSDDISDVALTTSRFIRAQEGKTVTSAVQQSLDYDLRDSRIQPTDGYFARVGQELAGVGGDAKYLRHTLTYGHFYSIADGWVLSGLTRSGHIVGLDSEDVRITDRFFLGGRRLRGFEPSGVGPRDAGTRDALGGNVFYTATGDLSFPLGIGEELDLRGSTFTEMGSLAETDDSGPRHPRGGLAAPLGRSRRQLPLAARADPARLLASPAEGRFRPHRGLPLQLRNEVLDMPRWKRLGLALALAFACVAGGGGVSAEEHGTRVAIIEMARIIDQSSAVHSIRAQGEAKRQEFQVFNRQEAERLGAVRDELERQQTLLAPAALEERQRQFNAELQEADRQAKARVDGLQRAIQMGELRFREALDTVVAEVAEGRGFDLVLPVQEALFAAAEFDLTDLVIERLNEAYPEIELSFDES